MNRIFFLTILALSLVFINGYITASSSNDFSIVTSSDLMPGISIGPTPGLAPGLYSDEIPVLVLSEVSTRASDGFSLYVSSLSLHQETEKQITVEQITGEQATVEQITGEQATVEQITGEQITGEQITGEQATVEQITVELNDILDNIKWIRTYIEFFLVFLLPVSLVFVIIVYFKRTFFY